MNSRFSLKRFNFHLPESQIARTPHSPRDQARLMVVRRGSNATPQDRRVADLPGFLERGDVLVLNNTKVFPARLLGNKPTGGRVECLLLHAEGARQWRCLVKGLPGIGGHAVFSSSLSGKVIGRHPDGSASIWLSQSGAALWRSIERLGDVPLPPYLAPLPSRSPQQLKKEYQTVFATRRGSAAAPTAGLHLTPRLLKKIKQRGVRIVYVTLHVGWGTFAPIRHEDIRKHQIHEEWGEVSTAAKRTLKAAHAEGRNILAVGTTALRVTEAACRHKDWRRNTPFSGWINLYITPADRQPIRLVTSLLTNYHLPQTSLFVLVCAMLGTERAQLIYARAKRHGYRWASFGDAMLIVSKR